jgi:hypothetical protein
MILTNKYFCIHSFIFQNQVTLFTNAGKLINWASYGVWSTRCGTTYVNRRIAVDTSMNICCHQTKQVTLHQFNQMEGFQDCCKLGMSLIEFGSDAEVKCIGDWNDEDGK